MRFSFHFFCAGLLFASGLACALDLSWDILPENEPLAHKLDMRLIPAIKALRAGQANDADGAREVKRRHGRVLAQTAKADEFVVRADAHITNALLAEIGRTGAVITNSAPKWNTVSLRATLSQIDKLSRIDGVRFITLQAGKRHLSNQSGGWVGSCPNEAFDVMNLNNLPENFTGAGVTVGVLSDSVTDTIQVNASATFSSTGSAPNIYISGSIPQNSGDLPSSFQVVAQNNQQENGPGTDEGEAMLELIHDIAPGAALAFGAVQATDTEFAANIELLQSAANCKIIADDVIMFDEPFFQDGPIAQAITANRSAGVLHFTAAGNEGNTGVTGVFTPMNPNLGTGDQPHSPPNGQAFHNWGIGGSTPDFLPIFLPAGDSLTVIMEWNQPYQSFNLGPGSQAAFDVFLYASPSIASNNQALVAQLGNMGTVGSPSGDPSQYFSFPNDYYGVPNDTTVYLCVNHFHGVLNNEIRVVLQDTGGNNGTYMSFPRGGVNGATSFGHPTSFSCVGVGAMPWNSENLNGNLSPETWSSVGGGFGSATCPALPFYFDGTGNLLPGAPVLRNAPDLLAPDGCTTSVFYTGWGYYEPLPGNPNGGQFNSTAYSPPGPDWFPTFVGTSCAAPNAAGAAAVLLEAVPNASPDALLSAMETSANKNTVPLSPNPVCGNGLVDVTAALQALAEPPTITSPSTAAAMPEASFLIPSPPQARPPSPSA